MSYVRYEDFGAVGDGVTNDFVAICKAHEYANNTCQKVSATAGKTYYIGQNDGKSAIIKTDTDWTGASFIIDDASIPPESRDSLSSIFVIASDYEKALLPSSVIDEINKNGGINRETVKKINTGLGYPAMLRVVDEEHACYIRYGHDANKGRAQVELVLVDEDGYLAPDTPFMLDYSHVSYIYARRADDRPITVSGGSFVTKVSSLDVKRQYYRDIRVSRNNVTVRNLDHRITGESTHERGPIYAGFLYVLDACNVLVEDSVFQSHKYFGTGTYDLLIEFTLNVTLRNCREHHFFREGDPIPNYYHGYWGIMGGNYSKNLVYERCVLSRFDSHAALYNARISDSTLAAITVTGGGKLIIENTEVYRHEIVNLRGDFGSTFNGEIILKNVRQNTFKPEISTVITIDWYNHDFGYRCYVPNVVIDGFSTNAEGEMPLFKLAGNMEKEGGEAHLEVFSDGTKNKNPYTPPDYVQVKNCEGINLKMPEHPMFSGTKAEGIKS